MFFDKYGFVNLEQSPFPGSIGDSCAETSRYVLLSYILGKDIKINLSPFITSKGVLRHPDSPWREDDTSDDQVSPLISVCSVTAPELAYKVIKQLEENHLKTGNGKLIHLTTLAQLERVCHRSGLWAWDIVILAQALILKLPYQWNDGKKKFTKTQDNSADYLNFINYLALASTTRTFGLLCKLACKIISKELALNKVQSYYAQEPNNQIILDLYAKAIPIIWNKP